MPSLNFDIELDELLWELTKREKQSLLNMLVEDGFTPPDEYESLSINEQLFVDTIHTIRDNYINLTKEELDIIIEMGKRF
jgi:hypothetical protein